MSDDIMVADEIEKRAARKKKRMLFLGLFSLIVLLVGFFLWLFGRKSYGTIATSLQVNELTDKVAGAQVSYEGKYITFTYPSEFDRREEVETVKYPLLERVYLTQSDIEGRKIAVVVQDNGGNKLEEYSSYRIRQMEPSIYRQGSIEYQGKSVTLFTKETNGPEIAIFFEHKSKVVSIVFSSPVTSDGLREQAEQFLTSFFWKGEENGV